MNNFKKIGMTALAASLVSTSVFAGEVTVAGSASMTVENYSSAGSVQAGKGFSMGNQLTFTGGGELDNGLTVGISFVLDQGDDTASNTAGMNPFDGHSVSISSDALGTLVMHGEGGTNAQAALDTTAAGDIWDTFDGTAGTAVESSASGADIMVYTLPSMVDGLSVSASYSPQQSGAASSTAYGLTYTGVEGLSVSYGKGDENLGSSALDTDTTSMKASYAYGSFTLAYSNNDHSSAVADADQETTSYKVSYTVSDAISVSYGTEEIAKENSTVDAEYEKLSVSYTSGGMTVSAASASSTDALHGTTDIEDRDYWSLGLSFAF
ncbi:porin [Candidatus Pelagibacter sp.]|nr:porin [Candidatus Pelagibacter sp.]